MLGGSSLGVGELLDIVILLVLNSEMLHAVRGFRKPHGLRVPKSTD